MPPLPENSTILAIDPTTKGFAFAVFETPDHLIDWGLRTAPAKSGALLQKVGGLLARHQPDLFVLEDTHARRSLRRVRARKEIRSMERLALKRGVKVARVSRLAVLDTLAPGKTKYEAAAKLAEIFPVLAERLPRKRKIWETEVERMSIFDALGFAVTARDGRIAKSGK
jgi:hypothetical protein